MNGKTNEMCISFTNVNTKNEPNRTKNEFCVNDMKCVRQQRKISVLGIRNLYVVRFMCVFISTI